MERKCPVCGEKTRAVKARSRLVVLKSDVDLCMHYKGIDPYLYAIIVCEHCGYAADEKHFTAKMTDHDRDKVQSFLNGRKIGLKFVEERALGEAVAAYKLAIFYAEMLEEKLAHRAGLYLKLAWIHRIEGDPEGEKPFLRKAAETYIESVMREDYPIGPMTEWMATFLPGAIYYELGEYDLAARQLSRLMGNQELRSSDPRMFDRVKNLWQEIREAKA